MKQTRLGFWRFSTELKTGSGYVTVTVKEAGFRKAEFMKVKRHERWKYEAKMVTNASSRSQYVCYTTNNGAEKGFC